MSSSDDLSSAGWVALYSQLIELSERRVNWDIHGHDWSEEAIAIERSRLQSQDALFEQLAVLRQKEHAEWVVVEPRARNMRLPINRLPDDVLYAIFEAYAQFGPVNPTVLAGVCHRWMRLVLGESGSSIWSYIQLGLPPHNSLPPTTASVTTESQRIAHWLMRSRAHPLHIRIHGKEIPLSILGQISQSAHRIKTIEIDVSFIPLPSQIAHQELICLRRVSVRHSRVGFGWVESDMGEVVEPVLLARSCPTLTHVELRSSARFISRALGELSAWAGVTHLNVDIYDANDRNLSSLYASLQDMREVKRLRWTDTNVATAAHPPTSVNLPKMEMLSLTGENAIRAFSIAGSAPSLRHLQLRSSRTLRATDAAGTVSSNLPRPRLYRTLFPCLNCVNFVDLDIPPDHLFHLLATHPSLLEVIWDASIESVQGTFGALAVVLSVQERINFPSGRLPPLLTFCHSPRLAPPSKGKKKKGRKPPTEDVSIQPFAEAFGCALDALLQYAFDEPSASPSSFSLLFRIGIAAQLAESTPELRRIAEDWPSIVFIRPYSISWVFEDEMA